MNRNNEVEAWLEAYENPMKDVVGRVRDIILHSDPRIGESIESEGPAFSYRGELASIFPHSKKHASLMFRRGGEIPGHHPRLEGSGDSGRVMKIASVAEANAAKDDLQHLVRSWCDWRDAERAESDELAAAQSKKKSATRKARRPRKKAAAARKTRRPAAKKATKPAAKKARKPSATKARKPAVKKAAKKARGSRARS